MSERFANDDLRFTRKSHEEAAGEARKPEVLLLPGSRRSELNRHLPVMLDAMKRIQAEVPRARGRMVLPSEALVQLAKSLGAPNDLAIQVGDLPSALRAADIAIASTGTVTMECAFFGVPTVTLYKTSWLTYEIAKRIVKVKSLTMPNLMANAEVFPEFIQNTATSENISRAAIELLRNEVRRAEIKRQLAEIIASLGGPGAIGRAAKAVASLLDSKAAGF